MARTDLARTDMARTGPARETRRPDRRRYAEEGAMRPRPGDRVPPYVRLYPVPTRYAYAPPPYPDPYMRPVRRPFLFGFFYRHPDADAYDEE